MESRDPGIQTGSVQNGFLEVNRKFDGWCESIIVAAHLREMREKTDDVKMTNVGGTRFFYGQKVH